MARTNATTERGGAFTPTCSAQHLPGFVAKAEEIKAKGVDTIACMAVNDPFVMEAWGKDQSVGDKVMMLADGSARFTGQLGMELDLVDRGLGVRSQRFAIIVDDGTVSEVLLDEAGAFEKSSAAFRRVKSSLIFLRSLPPSFTMTSAMARSRPSNTRSERPLPWIKSVTARHSSG